MHGRWRSIRRRLSSSTVWVAALSVCAFVLLTGAAAQSRLEAKATVQASARSTYDILIRPAGAVTERERATGRVRANVLSTIYGGITRAQLSEVRAVTGVEVAAPIAMLGQVMQTSQIKVDVTDLLAGPTPAAVAFSTQVRGSGGLRSWPGPFGYVYVDDGVFLETDDDGRTPIAQKVAGREVIVCDGYPTDLTSPFSATQRWSPQCYDREKGRHGGGWDDDGRRIYAQFQVAVPMVMAAVDPDAENALTGLDRAMLEGRPLRAGDGSTRGPADFPRITLPIVVSPRADTVETTTVEVSRLPQSVAAAIRRGLSREEARKVVTAAQATSSRTTTVTSQDALDVFLRTSDAATVPLQHRAAGIFPEMFFRTSAPRLVPESATAADSTGPAAVAMQNDPAVWRSTAFDGNAFAPVSPTAQDPSFRSITPIPLQPGQITPEFAVVGTFDPGKVAADTGLGRVPLETYRRPEATATDAATRRALGADALYPSGNPGSYLQAPPLLLTSLEAIDPLLSSQLFAWPDADGQRAPISAIRVRVAGVTGVDPVSRERVRLAAEQIQQRTGLAVDIVTGSSPAQFAFTLPVATDTELNLRELWTAKGVAVRVTKAIDTKSLALFFLVLAAAALSTAVTTNAEIRSRRTELGILAALGWRPRTLRNRVLRDALGSGLLAGLIGALLAVPIGALIDAPVDTGRAALAIPAALLVVLLASLWPAVVASRSTPAQALLPPVTSRARGLRLRGLGSMIRVYAARTPARILTGAVALALGVAALVALVGITTAFDSAVVGSLLGDAIVVQVRGADIVAAVIMVVLAVACLAQILRLDIREQRAQYAALIAVGWRQRTLGALVVGQGLLVGVLGAALGVGVGLGALALIDLPVRDVLGSTALIAGAAVLVAGLVSLLPARTLRTLPTAQLLAEE